MRSMKLVAVVAMLTACVSYGATSVTYTIETGGNNHVYEWETQAVPMAAFSGGVSDGSTTVTQGSDLTWSVKVTAAGTTGAGAVIGGAANLVFDVELYQADGTTPVAGVGAAPLACTQTVPTIKGCAPTDKGFWSNINDGDTDNPNNPAATRLDILANAAFAWTLSIPDSGNAGPYRLIDPAAGLDLDGLALPPTAPNFDYGWFPTSNGRGGVDTAGSKPINTGVTTVDSKLVGFGAGYKSFSKGPYYAGVGMDNFGFYGDPGYGAAKVLFEGQLNTTNLPLGTYVLKVVPSADGNNIIHGDIAWDSTTPDYGAHGSFAMKADSVSAPATVSFQVIAAPCIPAFVGRYVFYNQCAYDGNKVAIDANRVVGANNDDGDAVDTSKAPLIETAGVDASTQVNYTTYAKGLNGLVYDVRCPTRDPVQADFTFQYYGRTGTSAPVAKTPTAFVIHKTANDAAIPANVTRVYITFATSDIQKGWLKVTVGTGFGVPAEAHWWGSCQGEAKNDAANMVINALDLGKVKASYLSGPIAPVTWDWDFDKNRSCNALDNSYSKSQINTPPTTAVQKISK